MTEQDGRTAASETILHLFKQEAFLLSQSCSSPPCMVLFSAEAAGL